MSSNFVEDTRTFASLVSHLGLEPLVFLIQIEKKLAAVPPTVFPISQRTEHVTHLINSRFATNYSLQTIRQVRNEIHINQTFINRLFSISNFDTFIDTYVHSNHNDSLVYRHFFNELILLPFTKECVTCKQEIRKYTYKSINVLDLDGLKPACVVEGYCSSCHLSYSLSSIESTNFATRYYSTHSLNNSTVFYTSGSIGFAHRLLNLFTSLLINAHCTFLGFATTIIDMIGQINPVQKQFLNVDYLSKRFQIAWLSHQLANFELMLGKSLHEHHLVAMPRSLLPDSRDIYFEESASYWYHLFVVFWSRHKNITNTCEVNTCSKCILTDGHQKPKRLICQADNVVDITIPEMGPITIGCPYPPLRQLNSQANGHRNQYCAYHQVETPIPDINVQTAHHLDKKDQLLLSGIDCNVYRDDMEIIRKNRSFGILVTFLSCGVTIAFDECITAEGMRSVTRHLLRALHHGVQLPDAMLYDTACALKIHWDKWRNTEFLLESKYTNSLPKYLAIDRFHQPNHKREICRTIMNADHPIHEGRFSGINSQIAEQNFKYLSRSKASLRCFNFPTSFVMILLISHQRNCKQTGISFRFHGISSNHFPDQIKTYYKTSTVFQNLSAKHHQTQLHQYEEDIEALEDGIIIH